MPPQLKRCPYAYGEENAAAENQRRMEADRMAADDIRRQAMETQSKTQKRKSAECDQSAKKKKQRNGDQAVVHLQEKVQRNANQKRRNGFKEGAN